MRLRPFLPLLLLTGCAPSVQLAAPPPLLSTGWSITPGDELAGETRRLSEALRSPELNALVAQALPANPDLGAATAARSQT